MRTKTIHVKLLKTKTIHMCIPYNEVHKCKGFLKCYNYSHDRLMYPNNKLCSQLYIPLFLKTCHCVVLLKFPFRCVNNVHGNFRKIGC